MRQENMDPTENKLFAQLIITSKEISEQILAEWMKRHNETRQKGIKYLKHLGISEELIPDAKPRSTSKK